MRVQFRDSDQDVQRITAGAFHRSHKRVFPERLQVSRETRIVERLHFSSITDLIYSKTRMK